MKPLLRFFVFMSRAALADSEQVPQQLYVAADRNENGTPPGPAPVRGPRLFQLKDGLSDRTTVNHASSGGKALFRASLSITAAPVSA
uniref:Uncharacterized protein n=1 Tax=Pseudomonas graminis TaxID=158627 RepID=A0A7C1X7S5_9PSED